MSYGGSSSGSGRIATAADSALSNPATNDVLVFNASTQKWTNVAASSLIGGSGSADSYVSNAQASTAYTLTLADSGKVIENTSSNALTITVPPESSVAFPIGTTIEILNYSTGSITLTGGAAGSVALRSVAGLRLTGQYAPAAIKKRATDEWIVTGATVV